jgi:UDP-N-acetylmuramoylalanine--D-glutamate ligase
LPPGPWLVVGLARSGLAAARALQARGEEVVVVDRGTPALVPDDVDAHVETDGLAQLASARAVVKSPGVPREAPVIARARARGVPVLGELELGWRLLPNEFIAVTGTNGKTTTAELLGHIHREAGLPVAVAGNVGTAVSGLAGALDERATVVCEASSFQLEDTLAFAPEGAVLLNVQPDHLDRHGTLEDYVAAKLQAFARQGNDDVAVFPVGLGVEDLGGCARRVPFGPGGELDDRSGQLWWDDAPLVGHDEIRLRGAHNRANAAAAAAIALARGVDRDAVRAGLRTFAGVEHRLEEVARRDGVLFVNDSKATNADAAARALASFSDIFWIAGGKAKAGGITSLDGYFPRIRKAYLIGEAAGAFAGTLQGKVPFLVAGTLDRAVELAARDAAASGLKEPVVLLSPACASYDQYRNFEIRGAAFRDAVRKLEGVEPPN